MADPTMKLPEDMNMGLLPFPDDAPFSDQQRAWLSGYLAGLDAQLAAMPAATLGASQNQGTIHILYGSQTGNAEGVAMQAGDMVKARGLNAVVEELDAVSLERLAEIERCLIVVSTYGEGEMPDNAELFWEALSASGAPRLEHMRYAVLGLGDTGYDMFCEAGKLLDVRFEQLGAQRITHRVDCDVDYEEPAEQWLSEAVPLAGEGLETGASDGQASASSVATKAAVWTRKNPYLSTVVDNRNLSGAQSAKEIRHIAFALGDSGIEYVAGDALGVIPENHSDLVELLLQRVGAQWDTAVDGFDAPLGDLLQRNYEIMTPPRDLLTHIHEYGCDDEFRRVFENGDKEALEDYLWGKDILDLLDHCADMNAKTLLSLLRPLQHRAYSISSSPAAHPDEIHLTVAAVRWHYNNRMHRGVASTWLADTLGEGGQGRIFLSPNKNFRTPADPDAPVIMVGPGTGIAPFRAFLQERQASDGSGKNWLFFGDQHLDTDFIYADEMEAFSRDGTLTRLDLAFSRDQSEKIYVQHRMRENGAALYSWLEEGGYFYVCGDATRMAKDVDVALHDVVRKEGGLSEDAAADYINNLKREKRYLRDVY